MPIFSHKWAQQLHDHIIDLLVMILLAQCHNFFVKSCSWLKDVRNTLVSLNSGQPHFKLAQILKVIHLLERKNDLILMYVQNILVFQNI